jgi:putative oxidoreductase
MTTANPLDYSASASRDAAPGAAYAATLGRILMSVIFLLSGFMKVTHLSGMAAQVHLSPAMLGLAGAAELVGGLSLLLGLWSRVGALGLVIFLIPTTLMFHNFWAAPPELQQAQMANFLKNVAIMGGLLMVIAFGSGPLSITPVRRASRANV